MVCLLDVTYIDNLHIPADGSIAVQNCALDNCVVSCTMANLLKSTTLQGLPVPSNTLLVPKAGTQASRLPYSILYKIELYSILNKSRSTILHSCTGPIDFPCQTKQ